MNSIKKTAAAVALGTVVVGAAFAVEAQANPFSFDELQTGYQLTDNEGKCGEGKCGEGKCGEAKHNHGEKAKEAKCGEGKCGEGKCGEAKAADKVKSDATKSIDKTKEATCGNKKEQQEGHCGSA